MVYMPASPRDLYLGRLRELGYPEHLVNGIGMNANSESSWDPRAEGDNGNAFGLLQWNGPRKRALMAFARQQGKDPGDPVVQADFTDHENQTSERRAYEAALNAPDAGSAAAIWVNQWERPAKEHAERRTAEYLGGGGMGAGGATRSSRGGGGLPGFFPEDDPDLPMFEPEVTWGDTIRGGLAAFSEGMAALGAGHGTNFAATDAFLQGRREQAMLRQGQEGLASSGNRTVAWLEQQGYTDLADLVRAGGDPKTATEEALKRIAEAGEAGPSAVPDAVLPDLYKSGQLLGTAHRGMVNMQDLMTQMEAALEAGDMEKFRALKEAAQSTEANTSLALGRYYSGGSEPSQDYFKQAGIGIPADLISEKDISELLDKYGGDVTALTAALANKLGPELIGSIPGMNWVGELIGKDMTPDAAANAFNAMRIRQARLRLGNEGQRLQREMDTRQNEYRGATGQDFSDTYPEGWADTVFDPSDPDGWRQ